MYITLFNFYYKEKNQNFARFFLKILCISFLSLQKNTLFRPKLTQKNLGIPDLSSRL